MINRCTNQNHSNYSRYGARGISVCAEWRSSFERFLSDMGPRPSPSHSIDRIDNDRGYEPGNCRWATAREQGANLAKNVWLEYDGKRLHLQDWARETGVHVMTLHSRLFRLGWSKERALGEPSSGRRSRRLPAPGRLLARRVSEAAPLFLGGDEEFGRGFHHALRWILGQMPEHEVDGLKAAIEKADGK